MTNKSQSQLGTVGTAWQYSIHTRGLKNR